MVPKESTPEPGFTLKELEAIARGEARRSLGLTPNGGWRWTAEDIAFAVAILDEAARSRAFRKAWSRGMTRAQARLWLSKALHNRLIDQAESVRRIELLDHVALDFLPAASDGRTPLAIQDQVVLVGRVVEQLSETGRWVAADYLWATGEWGMQSRGNGRSKPPAIRTQERERARLREILRSVANEAGLTREETLDLVVALGVTLAGGVVRKKNPRIRGGFAPRRALDLVEA